MTEVSSSLFSSGLSEASDLRARLLKALGAEPEWTVGFEDSPDIVWLAGPVPTFFSVQAGGPLTPRLGVLTVRTRCAWVENLHHARDTVEYLNTHTTLNRWVVLGDPGPKDWFDAKADTPDDLDYDWDSEDRRRNWIASRPARDWPVSVDVAVSFVVGDASTDVPFEAVLLAVSEQIAKATAVVTNNFAKGWGEEAVADLDGRQRTNDQWHPVVHHYDNYVTPFAAADAAPLLSALVEAFTAERTAQFKTSASAWYGGGDETGFVCEVPYGPGPFDEGVIGMNGPRGIPLTAENQTSLISASLANNPDVGNGLLITLRVPGSAHLDDPSWWQAALLNAQSRIDGGGASAGMAHGFGAWAVHNDEPQHVMFLPASWEENLPDAALVLLLRQVLGNFARVSWAARRVLEPNADVEVSALSSTEDITASGLAAGPRARGLQFGEPGVGTDAGAEVLAVTWMNMVVPDTQWARVLNEPAGFEFWPDRHMQRITTTSCSCADPGSRISIDTPLLWGSSPHLREQAMRVQAEGWPAALISNGYGLFARTVLHVHDDSKDWAKNWSVPLAVAQALLAEELDRERGDVTAWTSDHPQSGRRHDRDEMLTLFDPSQEWLTRPAWYLNREVLALASSFPEPAPYALSWLEERVLMDWSMDIDFQDGSSRSSAVRTTYGPSEHPTLGRCLRISTDLQVDVDDPPSWCLEINQELTSDDTFVLGGLAGTDGRRVTFTTVVPVAFDRSESVDRHASFVGTSLNHHVSAVAKLLLNVDHVEAPELTTALLSEGYGRLADFYRESGLKIPAGLSTVLTEAGGGAALTVFRPWTLPGQISQWPRLGAFDPEGEPSGVRTVVPLDAMPVWLAARFAQASILGAVKPRFDGELIGLPLSVTQLPLSTNDINLVLGSLVNEEILCLDADRGELLVSSIHSRIVLTAEYSNDHPAWGNVLTITAECQATQTTPATHATHTRDAMVTAGAPQVKGNQVQIGDWHFEGDCRRYRVCLPPQAFTTPQLDARRRLFAHAVRSVAAQATVFLESLITAGD